MKKLLMYLLFLLPLAIASCGGDDDPSPTLDKTKAQVFQLKYEDTFNLDGIQFNWYFLTNNYDRLSSITSSVNLKFYHTRKSNINDVKIPDVDIKLWKSWTNEAELTQGGTIMAVETSMDSYIYYCIFGKAITDGGHAFLGTELTIYRMK